MAQNIKIPQIFKDCLDVGNVYFWDNTVYNGHSNEWRKVYDSNVDIRGSQLSDRDGIMVLSVNSLSYSDYSGSTHSASNHRVFLEQFGDIPGVHEVIGHHGHKAIALEFKALKNKGIQETLACLAQYPVLSEDDLSDLEHSAYIEAWESNGCYDFKRAILLKFEDQYSDDGGDLDTDLDEQEDRLLGLYESLIPSGCFYIPQHGDGVCIPVEDAVKGLTYEALIEFLNNND